jgi:hypothetical protein
VAKKKICVVKEKTGWGIRDADRMGVADREWMRL